VVFLKFKEELKNLVKLSEEEFSLLPSGFQTVGSVAVLNLPKELDERAGMVGEALMKAYPRIKTVCVKTGGVKGFQRLPSVKKVAGNGTVTVHRESGVLFRLDVSKVMFSKGNLFERSRLVKEVGRETVVDLFAGIGYFSIPIARFCPVKRVVGVEVNPSSFRFLKENVELNSVEKVYTPVLGDCRKVVLPRADRVLMGFFPGTEGFLDTALKIVRKGGRIHYHNIARSKEEFLKPVLEKGLKVLGVRKVKSFAPRVWHWVADLTT